MKYLFVFLFLYLVSPSLTAKTKEPVQKTWSGYLIDKMCAKRRVGDTEKLKAHTKTCLTEESCATSGYGLVVGKKFIPFDAKGNAVAANYLKTTPKENDFHVEVTGTMKNNKISATEIK
jgi:hypothetical protein